LVLQGRGDNSKRQSRAIRAGAVITAVFALFGGGALAFASDFEHPDCGFPGPTRACGAG